MTMWSIAEGCFNRGMMFGACCCLLGLEISRGHWLLACVPAILGVVVYVAHRIVMASHRRTIARLVEASS